MISSHDDKPLPDLLHPHTDPNTKSVGQKYNHDLALCLSQFQASFACTIMHCGKRKWNFLYKPKGQFFKKKKKKAAASPTASFSTDILLYLGVH